MSITTTIMKLVQDAGADYMEIGIPYSDPVADGPVIQNSDQIALQNGMSISTLFDQLKSMKGQIHIPIILMGYLNPVMKFGFESFCKEAQEAGVSGLILPDLPPYEFEKKYQKIIEKHQLNFSFLITPETPDERIQYLDRLSSGFLYVVSSSSTTGNIKKNIDETYFKKLKTLGLKNETLVGFGIASKEDFNQATLYTDGGIIGSAFVKILSENNDWEQKAINFIQAIRG